LIFTDTETRQIMITVIGAVAAALIIGYINKKK